MKTASTLKLPKHDTIDNKYHKEAGDQFNYKKGCKLRREWKEQLLFEKREFSKWIRKKRIPVAYRNITLELQLTSVSTYLEAFITPK